MIFKVNGDVFYADEILNFTNFRFLENFDGTDEEYFEKYSSAYPADNIRIFDNSTSNYFTDKLNELWYIPNRENNINDLL